MADLSTLRMDQRQKLVFWLVWSTFAHIEIGLGGKDLVENMWFKADPSTPRLVRDDDRGFLSRKGIPPSSAEREPTILRWWLEPLALAVRGANLYTPPATPWVGRRFFKVFFWQNKKGVKGTLPCSYRSRESQKIFLVQLLYIFYYIFNR